MENFKKEIKTEVLTTIGKDYSLNDGVKKWLNDNIEDLIDIVFGDSEAIEAISNYIIESRISLYNQMCDDES